jgi:hypothetical protein
MKKGIGMLLGAALWYFSALPPPSMNGPGQPVVWPNGKYGSYMGATKAECEEKRTDYLNAFRSYYDGIPDLGIAPHCAHASGEYDPPANPAFYAN